MDISQLYAHFSPPDLSAYPEFSNFSRADMYRDMIGGGGLYLAARMARTLGLHPGDIVLDLGCGKGETSVFLARQYGARVLAVDWWHAAELLDARFRARGYRDRIVPLHLDANQPLPFGAGYFDAIFCMNAFSFFGGEPGFLPRLLGHLRQGGTICIGQEALTDDFTPEQLANPPHVYNFRLPPPNDWINIFESDFMKQHTPGWWRELFAASGLLHETAFEQLEDAEPLYAELCIQEHEQETDPFDVQMLLEQIEWGRHNRPAKTLFYLTAAKP